MGSNQRRTVAAIVAVVLFIGLLAALTKREAGRKPATTTGERPGAQKQVIVESALQSEPRYLLGGLERGEVVRGERAIAQVAHLHGKAIGLADAFVARYGSEGSGATLWVGRASRVDDAEAMIAKMTAGIQDGGSPFVDLKKIMASNREIYTLSGMGQRHAYFAAGRRTVWVAADSTVFTDVLRDLVSRQPN